jgi:hypothetical protein
MAVMTCLKGNIRLFIMDKPSNGANHRVMLRNILDSLQKFTNLEINNFMKRFEDQVAFHFCEAYINEKKDRRDMEAINIDAYISWLSDATGCHGMNQSQKREHCLVIWAKYVHEQQWPNEIKKRIPQHEILVYDLVNKR